MCAGVATSWALGQPVAQAGRQPYGPGPQHPRAGRPGLASVLTGGSFGNQVVRLGALPGDRDLVVTLGLRQRNELLLARLLGQGRAVQALRYSQDFGPGPASVHAAERVLGSYGLRAAWAPGDAVMEVSGRASALERVFSVALSRYRVRVGRERGRVFYAPAAQPRLASPLRGLVTSVLGLDDYPVGRAPVALGATAAGRDSSSSPQSAGGYTPSQVAGLYHFGPLYQGGLDGAGQTVVFLEIDAYQAADIVSYSNAFGLPAPVMTGPVLDPAWGSPQPATASTEPTEATLDLEVVHALAPRAHLVVYESAATSAGMVAALQAAVSAYPHAVFSYSLADVACGPGLVGEDPADAQQFSAVLEQLVSHGGTFLASSGDSGAYSCLDSGTSVAGKPGTQVPADSPYATAVGGTTAFLGAGSTYGQEAAWGDPVEEAGGGGGLSAIFARPSWQAGPGVLNQFSNGHRQVPDVSALADTNTGWDIYSSLSDPQWVPVGGTSAAAPLWAALVALADQALAERGLPSVGFANPALYDFGANPGRFPAPAFHDVRLGNNLYYPAAPGWDFATGWGSPDASALVDDLIAYQRGTR